MKFKWESKVYPDFDRFDLELIEVMLAEYGLKVDFRFDEGIEFSWTDDTIFTKDGPGDVVFYKVGANGQSDVMLIFTEGFDSMIFSNLEKVLFEIPIYDFTNFDWNKLDEIKNLKVDRD